MTRILVIAGVLATATLLGGWTWGFDRQGPYCLYDRNYTSCGFPTIASCWATASGAGGYCAPNPGYVPDRAPAQRRRVK